MRALIYAILVLVGGFVAVLGLSMIFGKESESLAQSSREVREVVSASMKRSGKGFFAVGAALIVGASIWFFWIRAQPVEKCGDEAMAYAMSQRFVERQLKAPDSASFPTMPNASSERVGECSFAVRAYVEAKNDLGMTVRSYYTTTMVLEPGTTLWRAENLSIVGR